MKTTTFLTLLLLMSGCICYNEGRGKVQNTPIINYYGTNPTTTTSSSTSSSTTSTIMNQTTTIETTTSTSTTILPPTTTSIVFKRTLHTFNETTKAPTLTIPPGYNTCKKDSDCLLVTDCCGSVGRQYGIHRDYRMRWYDNLHCWNSSIVCITNMQLTTMRYPYIHCDNQTCDPTYNKPDEKSLTN